MIKITRSRQKHPDFFFERSCSFPKLARHRTVDDNELEEDEDKMVVVVQQKGRNGCITQQHITCKPEGWFMYRQGKISDDLAVLSGLL